MQCKGNILCVRGNVNICFYRWFRFFTFCFTVVCLFFFFSVFLGRGGLCFLDTIFFDIVIASAVMHHTPDPDFYLEELKRVLKPGGSILLVEEMYHNLLDKRPYLHIY